MKDLIQLCGRSERNWESCGYLGTLQMTDSIIEIPWFPLIFNHISTSLKRLKCELKKGLQKAAAPILDMSCSESHDPY
jgi:hypothetical protein